MSENLVQSLLSTIRYLEGVGGGGALEFLAGHIDLFHKGDGKLYFFTSG